MNGPEMKQAVKARISYLEKQLNAAKAFLLSLEGEESASPPNRLKRAPAPEHKTDQLDLHSQAQDGVTHRAYLRTLLHQHSNGLAPAEMRKLTEAAGRSTPASYPYTQLKILVKDGEARKVKDKYFPAGNEGSVQ